MLFKWYGIGSQLRQLPWLADEKRVIAQAVRAGVPFFGVCLGVQLLAASLGGRVFAGADAGGRPVPGHAHRRSAR
jgi:GMP synthase-like glutamine amidotransferase